MAESTQTTSAAAEGTQSMRDILASSMNSTTGNGQENLPTYAEVTEQKTALTTTPVCIQDPPAQAARSSAASDDIFDNLKFSPKSAVVGKATCIQLKPSGTEAEGVLGRPNFLQQNQCSQGTKF